MIKLKPLILEYVSNPIVYLIRYLKSTDKDKATELAFSFPEYIYQFMGDKIKDDVESMDYVENLYSKNRPEFDRFAEYVFKLFDRGIIGKDHYMRPGYPSWNYMEFRGMIKNQWLIHFSDDAYDIWRHQKFSYGTEEMENLGLTTYINKESKKFGGYNFAYDVSDYLRHGRSSYRSHGWKYGKEAVLFKASGVKIWHFGDEEPQVIFVGNTARDIVYIKSTDPGPWGVGDSRRDNPVYIGEFSDVVNWIQKNFNQYKKALLPRR